MVMVQLLALFFQSMITFRIGQQRLIRWENLTESISTVPVETQRIQQL